MLGGVRKGRRELTGLHETAAWGRSHLQRDLSKLFEVLSLRFFFINAPSSLLAICSSRHALVLEVAFPCNQPTAHSEIPVADYRD